MLDRKERENDEHVLAGTIEYEAELRHKNEMLRVEAEIKGK